MNRLKTFAKFEETKAIEKSKPASWAFANKYKDKLIAATKSSLCPYILHQARTSTYRACLRNLHFETHPNLTEWCLVQAPWYCVPSFGQYECSIDGMTDRVWPKNQWPWKKVIFASTELLWSLSLMATEI